MAGRAQGKTLSARGLRGLVRRTGSVARRQKRLTRSRDGLTDAHDAGIAEHFTERLEIGEVVRRIGRFENNGMIAKRLDGHRVGPALIPVPAGPSQQTATKKNQRG